MIIVLDAGHGYNTMGKRSPDGLREYEINRSIASYVLAYLKSYPTAKIVYTHSDHEDVSLTARTNKANAVQADCFISIHCNAAGDGTEWHDAAGIETYIYNNNYSKAKALAEKVQKNLIVATGLRNRGIKTANFHVLRETRMTAILVECGFMTNKAELQLLKSDTYRKACGEAIAKAIIQEYKLLKSPPSILPNAEIGTYKVQIGAFKNKQHADRLASTLKQQGYEPYIVFEK